eukprot:gene13191-biopygen10520
MPFRRYSRVVQFINTAPADERCLFLKSMEKINELPDNSMEIESDNVIKRYQRRPHQLENICLADFVAWYETVSCMQSNDETQELKKTLYDDLPENDLSENHDDDCITNCDLETAAKTYKLPGGLKLVRRTKSKVLRSIRYDKNKDPENYFRERLMLYLPWRNEYKDLLCGCQTFEESYKKMQHVIDKNSHNERYSAVLQQVAEDLSFDDLNEYSSVAPNAQHHDDQDKETGSQASKLFGCFNPTSSRQSEYDLLDDIGIYPRSEGSTAVETQTISDLELREKVQLLNNEQMEFFYHVLHSVKANKEPLRLFLSGGAGVGKSFVLNTFLPIVVGGKYDLTSNIKTTDGLTNDAECTIAKIDYRVANSTRPSIIWVKFTEERIGKNHRSEFIPLRGKEMDTSWTPIFEVKKQFVIGRSRQLKFMRRQFPLRQAAAKTIHQCQGDTMQNLVVSFAGRPRDHIHYVGLSRVVSIHGLFIEILDEGKITISEKVKEEMKRLRLWAKYMPSVESLFKLSATFKVIFHNVRSLPLHKYDVFHDFNVSSTDINIFVETNLTSKHSSEDFVMAGFQLHRNDNTEGPKVVAAALKLKYSNFAGT